MEEMVSELHQVEWMCVSDLTALHSNSTSDALDFHCSVSPYLNSLKQLSWPLISIPSFLYPRKRAE